MWERIRVIRSFFAAFVTAVNYGNNEMYRSVVKLE